MRMMDHVYANYEAYVARNIAYMHAAAEGNKEVFKELKGCFIDKDVVVCGAGPTLVDYKPIEGAIHIALNRALLQEQINFDWFIASDWVGIDFIQQEIIDYDCVKFLGRFSDEMTKMTIPQSFGYKCNAKWFYTDLFLTNNGFDGRFVCDIDKMPIGGMPNIALEAMQIALFTHPRRLYLAGCDATSGHNKEIDVGKEREETFLASLPNVAGDKTLEKWMVLKRFANTFYPDVEIISINPVGLKGIFNDVYQ